MDIYKIAQVDFPFEEISKSKSRPCLVLTKPKGKYQSVIIAYMTSNHSQIENTDFVIDSDKIDFEETGLTKTTIIKLHRLEHISIDSLKGQIGNLSIQNSKQVKQKLSLLFELEL